jgi:hypothetical protein
MELTEEQIKFLNDHCKGKWTLNENGEVDVEGNVTIFENGLTDLPVKFGKVNGTFFCSNNKLTTLKNYPTYVGGAFYCYNNKLTDYFKSIKEDDFPLWDKMNWLGLLGEYPFLINIGKKYAPYIMGQYDLNYVLNKFPQTKLYLK